MKKWIPAIIIGLVGGFLDTYTDLHKIWCFLIGVAAFVVFLFVESIFKTIRIRKQAQGAKKIWLDQNNNIVRKE